MAQEAVEDAEVPSGTRAGDRLGERRVGTLAVSQREPRERQHPEREVAPGRTRQFQPYGQRGVCQRILGPPAAHPGTEHRSPGFEGGGPVGWRTTVRPALRDLREMLHHGDRPLAHVLPCRDHREPRVFDQGLHPEPREPGLDGRATSGPVDPKDGPADRGCRKVLIASGDGVLDRHLDGIVSGAPADRPVMQLRDDLGLPVQELLLQDGA